MRGICGHRPDGDVLSCPNNTRAEPLPAAGQQKLQTVCPQLASELGQGTGVCCTEEQLDRLQAQASWAVGVDGVGFAFKGSGACVGHVTLEGVLQVLRAACPAGWMLHACVCACAVCLQPCQPDAMLFTLGAPSRMPAASLP